MYKDFCVQMYYSVDFGDNISSVLVFLIEFDVFYKEYFVLFCCYVEYGLQVVVLLGFVSGENLFLNEYYFQLFMVGSWMGCYVLGLLVKGLFMIGYQ